MHDHICKIWNLRTGHAQDIRFCISRIFLSICTGAILLEDYHLVEKLANFDYERIPECVVHAKGESAKGFFEFSTVIYDCGSPETLRDPRSFAVKFYTTGS
ncbi:catalase-like isoform X2 [Ipomoea triloba]|uniref:catalase-like isoform X2 n=1 Tax=Ipomoea triloba TaxID=35885 RepID=UPI00125DDA3B|nr:catalase-like isoform X2 [Ipomoea triloba]XP_031099077.1 catalase-like isoform X2 [Ipomoea triloba]